MRTLAIKAVALQYMPQVYEVVNVRGMLLFSENKPEMVPTKPDLKKLEGYVVDETGSVAITIWNEQIKQVMDGQFFQIDNVWVRQFQGHKYLSTMTATKVEEVSVGDTPKLDGKIISDGKSRLDDSRM